MSFRLMLELGVFLVGFFVIGPLCWKILVLLVINPIIAAIGFIKLIKKFLRVLLRIKRILLKNLA